jgi:hypothetical protein
MDYVSQMFVGMIVGLFTAFLAVHHLMQDKWWDRKWETYSEILSALCDAAQYAEQGLETYESMGENKPATLVSRNDNLAAVWKVKRTASIGTFIVRDAAINVLEGLPFAVASDWGDAPAEVIFSADIEAYKKAIPKIRDIACKDLKKKWFEFWTW